MTNSETTGKWLPVRANNEEANMAESVMQAADSYIDGFGVVGLSFFHYRNVKGCTEFSDRDTAPRMVVRVRWDTCCEQHPIVIESVEFTSAT